MSSCKDNYGLPLAVGDTVAYNAEYKGTGTCLGIITKIGKVKISIKEKNTQPDDTYTTSRYPDGVVKVQGGTGGIPVVIVIKRPDDVGYLVYGPFATPELACEWGEKNLKGDWVAEPVTGI
jgi:hypothetical protein